MNNRGAVDPLVLAFYLPQFHPTPENDAWWGRGFTEWTNVVKGAPRFAGHYQPHYPGELGFYDLRLPEVREQQADLARGHGIDGFCYYHYWFHGRRILGRPFDEVLSSGSPDFPFCLAWANENWTRTWDAGTQSILVPQTYDPQDDVDHIAYLIRAFADPRYIRLGNQPLLFVYRVQAMPDPQRTFDLWRTEAERAGVGVPYIVKFDTHGNFDDPKIFGCDAASEFLPHGVGENLMPRRPPDCPPDDLVFPYGDLARFFATRESPPWVRFPSILPGWDNSARRVKKSALIVTENDPQMYEWWLTQSMERAARQNPKQPIVLVNAWNEWAEGAHLEPDERFGRDFLEANERAVRQWRGSSAPLLNRSFSTGIPETATFAQLYLDVYDRLIQLQDQHTELLETLERRIEAVSRDERALLRQAQSEAANLATWVGKLRSDLEQARRLLLEQSSALRS